MYILGIGNWGSRCSFKLRKKRRWLKLNVARACDEPGRLRGHPLGSLDARNPGEWFPGTHRIRRTSAPGAPLRAHDPFETSIYFMRQVIDTTYAEIPFRGSRQRPWIQSILREETWQKKLKKLNETNLKTINVCH